MFKRIALFFYLAAFFTIFCGYTQASDNLLRLPSMARYSSDRLDKAVRHANAGPMNPFLIFEGNRGNITIDDKTIVIGTGGGDCAGLNAFIRKVVLDAYKKGYRVVGVRNCYDGMTADNWEDMLVELTPENTGDMTELPSTVLGSCRRKLSKDDLVKILERFGGAAGIIITGGNDHIRGVEEIAGAAKESGKEGINLRTVGVPKSIDNDFRTAMLGFKSAYRLGRQIASRASLDPENAENKNKVAVFEVMGRKSGSLTINCAKGCPYTYASIIPERKVTIDGIISAAVNAGIKNFFVSEGFSLSKEDPKLQELLESYPILKAMWDKATKSPDLDVHGNPKLTGASLYVAGILKHFCNLEVEMTDLTYELRGTFPQAGASDPVAFDIALAELFGSESVSIVLDKTKESGLALTYHDYENANRPVEPKPARDVYQSINLKDVPDEELAKFGVLGLGRSFNVRDQVKNVEVPKIDGSIESAARRFSYGINISTRTHKGASVVEFRIPDEAIVSACGREQDLESLADGRGLRIIVEATKDSALLLISQEGISFSEIADKISNIYNKFGYVNIAISNNFPLNKDDKFLQKILAKDPVLNARFESEAKDLGDGWVRFDSGVSHFIVGLFKECGVKKGTRVTNSGYAFKGLTATSSQDILKDNVLLARQGVVMARPAAVRLAADSDAQRKDRGSVLQLLEVLIGLRDEGQLGHQTTRKELIKLTSDRHLSPRTIAREIKGLQIAGIIEPEEEIRFAEPFKHITLDDAERMNKAAEDIVNKGLDRWSLDQLTPRQKKRLKAVIHDAVTSFKDEVIPGAQFVATERGLLRPATKERLTNILRVNVIITKSPHSARLLAAREITNLVKINNENKRPTVIGVMAGEELKDVYKEVIRLTKEAGISWHNVIIINVDEFIHKDKKADIGGEFSRSGFIEGHLLKELIENAGLKRENIHMFNGYAKDVNNELQRFDNRVKGLTVDLQLLDISSDGNIGFITGNPRVPREVFMEAHVDIMRLTDYQKSMLAKGAEAEDTNVPSMAYSMSLGQLLQAKEVLAVCTGLEKADTVKRIATEDYAGNVLASLVQLHKNAIMVMDTEAGRRLVSLAKLSRKSHVSRLEDIVVIPASHFISISTLGKVDKDKFEGWLRTVPERCAVVVICMPKQFKSMQIYRNLAYIQDIEKIGIEFYRDLPLLFETYGKGHAYDNFRLAGPYKKGEYVPLIEKIASEVFPEEFFKYGGRVDFTKWQYTGSVSIIRMITSPDITAERVKDGSFMMHGRPMRVMWPLHLKAVSSSL